MKTIDIAPDQWPRFCDDFTRQHRGWLVTTSILAQASRVPPTELEDSKARHTACDLPFAGLSLEPNHRDLRMLLGEGNTHISEPIPGVTRICMLETDDGAHAGLRIDRSDDSGVLIKFRIAAVPESLDGVAASER